MSSTIVLTRRLLVAGVVAGPLFVGALLLEGATRPGYNAMRHPLSLLALGDLGWVQSVNFVVAGLLTLAFAFGLRQSLRPRGWSMLGPIFLALWAVGLLGAGLFTTDPMGGYPPGSPDHLDHATWHGFLHGAFSVVGLTSIPAACLVFGRRFASTGHKGWAAYSVGSGLAYIVLFVVYGATAGGAGGLDSVGGLLQRIVVAVGWCWLTLIAVHFMRAAASDRKEGVHAHSVPRVAQ